MASDMYVKNHQISRTFKYTRPVSLVISCFNLPRVLDEAAVIKGENGLRSGVLKHILILEEDSFLWPLVDRVWIACPALLHAMLCSVDTV